jgi:hypothetical protein
MKMNIAHSHRSFVALLGRSPSSLGCAGYCFEKGWSVEMAIPFKLLKAS